MQRLSPRFRSQQFFLCKICGETFSPNFLRFVWRCRVGAHPDGHQHGDRKPTETSVTECCYKSANLSLEELRNNTIILFPIQESNRSDSQIPRNKSRNKSPFNQFGRHVNAASRKSLKIQAWSIIKPKTHSEQKFEWILVFSCSYTSLRKNIRGINNFVV